MMVNPTAFGHSIAKRAILAEVKGCQPVRNSTVLLSDLN